MSQKSRLLRISSRDKALTSNSKYDMIFITNDNDLAQASRVTLKSAVIPNTQYNININNNTFVYDSYSGTTGVRRDAVVPVGQYTSKELINALSNMTDLIITQDTITLKLTFTLSQSDIDLGKVFSLFNNVVNPMADALGISDTVIRTSIMTVSSLPDLVGLRHIYISSSTLSNNIALIDSDKQKSNVFCDIPINVGFGNVQIEDNDNNTLDYTDFHSRKNISTIDIKLMDEKNNVLDLNGLDYVLVFRVFF